MNLEDEDRKQFRAAAIELGASFGLAMLIVFVIFVWAL